jgi:hypothetical protein
MLRWEVPLSAGVDQQPVAVDKIKGNIYVLIYRNGEMVIILGAKVGNHFADKRRSLGRYSSLADSDHGV